MAKIDKLLKNLVSKNIAKDLSEEELHDIAINVIKGFTVDEKTRETWLDVNRQAMEIIKHVENLTAATSDLYDGQCKVIYPLLVNAVVQLAARLSQHVVRNGKTAEMTILGKDKQIPDPDVLPDAKQQMMQLGVAVQQGQMDPQQAQQQAQQIVQNIPKVWEKQTLAKRVGNWYNYDLLIRNNQWLSDEHKLNTIVASWGTGFKRVYYDFITKNVESEVIDPEDVVINHNISSLDKAPRVSVVHYLTKNEVVGFINSGHFLDLDVELLQANTQDEHVRNDSDDSTPVYKFIVQYCDIDLDGDGYAEPYKVYVHEPAKLVFCIVAGFDKDDIKVDEETGKVYQIIRRLDIVDRHCIDSPDGKYYSLGLNYLLLHQNKAITSIQRQLIDAGTLSNAAGVSGFVTKAFKTRERELRVQLGKFQVLDCDPSVDPQAQIMNLPFKEPSQVLLGLLQLLIDTAKNNAFLNDVLSGDADMQNVPATTTLAMVEQSTRAFKPMITKLQISLKKEFDIRFRLYGQHLDKTRYARFQGDVTPIESSDFNYDSFEVSPVADPTSSSEAHTYAKLRALIEGIQVFGPVTNMEEAAKRYYTDMQFSAPEMLVQKQQQDQDPRLLQVQLQAQIAQLEQQNQQGQLQLQAAKIKNQELQTQLKSHQVSIKATESQAKISKMEADIHRDAAMVRVQEQQADNSTKKVEVDKLRAETDAKLAEQQAKSLDNNE